MRRAVGSIIFVCVFLLLVHLIEPIQEAKGAEKTVNPPFSGTATVANNSYDAYLIPLTNLNDMLSVTVSVTSGSYIDAIMATELEYQRYKTQHNCTPLPYNSELDTRYAFITMRPKDTTYGIGTYVTIIENNNWTRYGAAPMGDVTYSIRISTMGPTMMTNLISTIVIIAVILIIAVIAGVVAVALHDKKSKKRAEVKKPKPAQQIVFCPTCALPAKYIEKHKRYYCKAEKKYLSKDIPPPSGK